MERDKLIELLENGSETELMLIQNYLLDRILKKMPKETEAIQRCIETSKKIRDLESEILNLRLIVDSLRSDIALERGSKYYNTDYYSSATGTGASWANTVTCSANSSNVTQRTTTNII
jgi:hypothetical protein